MRRILYFGLFVATLMVTPAMAADRVLPNDSVTPGAVDPNVRGTEICVENWTHGSPTPVQGGSLSYSKAARHKPKEVKDQAFTNYGIDDPRDNGHSFEVDHRVPLSLGGLDAIENLWPESRTAGGFNAWVKDRLDLRVWRLVCHPKPGDPHVTLKQAQDAFLGDWTVAYKQFCEEEDDCPAFGADN